MEHVIVSLVAALFAVTGVAAVPDDFFRNSLQFDPNGQSTRGTNFVVAFIPNSPVLFSRPNYKLLISTAEEGNVTFTVSLNDALPAAMRVGFPHTATISYGEVHSVDLHPDIALAVSGGSNAIERAKAIRIQSEGEKQISVQGFNDDVRTTDGFIAIACDAMYQDTFVDYEYLTLAADQFPSPDDPPKNSFILIIACEDNTRIRVEPTQVITVTHLTDLRPNRLRAGPGISSSLTLTADAAQSLLIGHSGDLSGTIVRSSRPLVVFTGHQCGEIPYNHTACDHMVEQIPHGMSYGQTFFLTPLGGRVSGDHFRVGTLRNGARVTVTCVTSASDTPIRLPLEGNGIINRGQYLKFMTPGNKYNRLDYKPSYCCLDSTEPVIVAQYSTGYSTDRHLLKKAVFSAFEAGDPFMNLVPPIHQFMNNHTVKSVDGVAGPFPWRYINLAIASDFFVNTLADQKRIKINDTEVVPYDGYIPFYCSNGRICGYGAQVEVPKGTHTIYHEHSEAGLFAAYYAYQQQNSNSFPLGFELEPLAATGSEIPEKMCVEENSGTLVIPVERYGSLMIQSKVTVATQPSSPVEAIPGLDYVHFEGSFTYRGGNRKESLKFVHIPIVDDNITEPRESFQVSFTPTRNLYLRNNVIEVVICDNDGGVTDPCICDAVPIEVWFEPSSYTVNEVEGIVTLTIRTNVAGGPPPDSVIFSTSDGTAIAGSDYISVSLYDVIFTEGSYITTVQVSITNDLIPEGLETFTGLLSVIGTANVVITQDTADVHIIDNDVEVWFDPSSYTVNEADGTVQLTIRTNIAGGPEDGAVRFITVDGTARALIDYISTSYDVTFDSGSYSTTVTVPIVHDSVGETDEVFYGTLTLAEGSAVNITQGQASIHVLDDDMRVWFQPSSYTVDESDGVVTLTVRTNVPGGPATGEVSFITVDGTAVSTSDYITTTHDVTFESGANTTTISVPIVDDSIGEVEEVFYGSLTVAEGSLVTVVQERADVSIVDDDLRVWFEPSSYTVNESTGTVTLIVRTNVIGGPSSGEIAFFTVDNTATSPVDYDEVLSSPVTFEEGSLSTTITVSINDDGILEQDESFFVRLVHVGRETVNITGDNARVIILDNDVVEIGFVPSAYTVTEGEIVFLTVVNRNPDLERDVVVQVETINGTAIDGEDFVGSVQTITFTAGSTSESVGVIIVEDMEYEGTENFFSLLTSIDNDVNIFEADSAIQIIDNDVKVFFEVDAHEFDETSGEVELCIKRIGDVSGELTVQVSSSDSVIQPAEGGSDYEAFDVPVTFEPSEDSACFDIDILDDALSEGPENFNVRISSVPVGVDIGTFESTTVSILDDESLIIDFVATSYTVVENETVATVCVRTNTGNDEPISIIVTTRHLNTSDGDYEGSLRIVTIPASESASITCFSIPITDDVIVEETEHFVIGFDVPSGTNANAGVFNLTRVIIIDNDNALIGFNPTEYTVEERGGVVIIEVENFTPELERDVAVQFFTVNGVAIDGYDYVGVSESFSHTLTFSPGMNKNYIFVAVEDDTIYEGTEEFYGILVPTESGGVTITQRNATVYINDNDFVEIGFVPETYTAEEGQTIVLFLENKSPNIESDVTVHVDFLNGTASGEADFIGTAIDVTFVPGEAQVEVPVTLIDDEVLEQTEIFFARVMDLEPRVNLFQASATVVIQDNDEVLVTFETDSYEVDEDGGSVLVCINREGEISETIEIQVSTAELVPSQAKGGSDFLPVTGQVVEFSPSQYRSCFPILIFDDDDFEGEVPENFTVTISALPLGVGFGNITTTTVSIVEDDELMFISAQLCGDVCQRLDRIDTLLQKICDKLDIQASQLLQVLSQLSPTALEDN